MELHSFSTGFLLLHPGAAYFHELGIFPPRFSEQFFDVRVTFFHPRVALNFMHRPRHFECKFSFVPFPPPNLHITLSTPTLHVPSFSRCVCLVEQSLFARQMHPPILTRERAIELPRERERKRWLGRARGISLGWVTWLSDASGKCAGISV